MAKITSLGALGESYLEVTTGTKDAPRAKPGSVLRSYETKAIADLGDMIGGLTPIAEQTMRSLNDRLGEMKVTIAQVNDLLGGKNRQNISSSLATLNAMLAETRPKISATLTNVQAASDKFPEVTRNVVATSERMAPLLEDLKGRLFRRRPHWRTSMPILVENRPDIRATMLEMRKTLETASRAVEALRTTLERNGDNLDESMANVRVADRQLERTDRHSESANLPC